jgi:serine kinase of HPr protein (carbohydrate metabolism regulator)
LQQAKELVHGTCVAFGAHAALLRGRSGSGKSDLALRFLALAPDGDMAPRLIADDQVVVEEQGGTLTVSAPDALAGKLEVRGLGIMTLPHAERAKLVLIVDLVARDEVPRMPPEPLPRITLLGVRVPNLQLAPFEVSAPLKLKMALISAVY